MKESAPFRLGYVFLTPPEPKAVEVCPVNGSILRGNCRNFRLARKVKAGLRRFKTQITPDNSLENPDGRARGRGRILFGRQRRRQGFDIEYSRGLDRVVRSENGLSGSEPRQDGRMSITKERKTEIIHEFRRT